MAGGVGRRLHGEQKDQSGTNRRCSSIAWEKKRQDDYLDEGACFGGALTSKDSVRGGLVK